MFILDGHAVRAVDLPIQGAFTEAGQEAVIGRWDTDQGVSVGARANVQVMD